MWCSAAMALGTVWRWPAVGVLLKPSLFPFALFGIRSRSWWIALAIGVALAIPFGAMWVDYLATLRNLDGNGPLFSAWYSLNNLSPMLLPLVAWAGRRPRAGAI